jgi:hypothetical protein
VPLWEEEAAVAPREEVAATPFGGGDGAPIGSEATMPGEDRRRRVRGGGCRHASPCRGGGRRGRLTGSRAYTTASRTPEHRPGGREAREWQASPGERGRGRSGRRLLDLVEWAAGAPSTGSRWGREPPAPGKGGGEGAADMVGGRGGRRGGGKLRERGGLREVGGLGKELGFGGAGYIRATAMVVVGWAGMVDHLAQYGLPCGRAPRCTTNIVCRAPIVHGARQSPL